MLFFFFYFLKKYHGFHKNIKQHNCFNTDNNNKCFLNSKSAY